MISFTYCLWLLSPYQAELKAATVCMASEMENNALIWPFTEEVANSSTKHYNINFYSLQLYENYLYVVEKT